MVPFRGNQTLQPPLAFRPSEHHDSRVTNLRELLRTLRDDIEAGLGRRSPVPAGVQLLADSVELTVHLEIDTEGARAVPCAPGQPEGGHALTIRFKVQNPSSPSDAASPVAHSPAESAPVTSLDERRPDIESACGEIFGPPGFDNAARAEVFCELARAEASQALQEALVPLMSGAKPSPDNPHSDLARRLRQLLGFSPAGTTVAASRLSALLSTHPKDDIIRVLSEMWRFGTHWA